MKRRVKRKSVKQKEMYKCNPCGCSGAGYFFGIIGSAVYYISTAEGFWMGVLGLLKSLVWPAFLVYEVLKYLAA
jgi:hypothetical protein